MRPGQDVLHDPLLVRCRREFFRDSHVPLRQSCLWVIDCRRRGGKYGTGAWESKQYTHAFAQLARWMTNIKRWNVIFLLPAGVQKNEELITKLNLPDNCTHMNGTWSFRTTPSDYPYNFKEGGNIIHEVEAIGSVIIYIKHPERTTVASNFGSATGPRPVVFHDIQGRL